MSKILQFNEDVMKSLLKGAKTLAKAVIVTLGPKGRNVIIAKSFGAPSSTKDGVTVAKEINLKNKFENVGAQLVKGAASKAGDVAGDGTTTAIVLADSILSEGAKHVAAGVDPMKLKSGIDMAVKALTESLDAMATPVRTPEEIYQIATISSNNDSESGRIIAEAMQKVGKDGIVTIGETKGTETTLKVEEGMQFDKGYLSPYFLTNAEKMSVELENSFLLITDKKFVSAKTLVPILEAVAAQKSKSLLIIAEDVEAEALATLVVNKVKGGLAVCAVKAPGFGARRKEILQDIAVLTGATLISEEFGDSLEDINISMLGSAKNIRITKDSTTIISGDGKKQAVEKRAAQIKFEIEESTSDYDREKLEERLANLVGGVAVIHVGAATEAEANEKKARIEDALHATRAAIAQGIVPGGGVALIRAAKALDALKPEGEEAFGVAIMRRAAFAPAIAIAENCGKNGEWVAEKIAEQTGAWGYNGLTDQFSDLIADGVIDPVFVTKSAITYAASVVYMMLSVSVIITDKPESKKSAAMAGGGDPSMDMGMGGMGGMGGMM